MAADIVDVAEAILTDLNADPSTNFGRDFTAVRSNGEFEYELKPGDFRADVVPAEHPNSDPFDRSGAVDHHVAVQVAIREGVRRVSGGVHDNTVIDPLRLILQKIQKFFIFHELTTLTSATFISSNYETDGSVKMLREFSTYLGIVRVTYEVVG